MSTALTLFDIVPGNLLGERFRVGAASRKGGLSVVFQVHDERDGRDCELQLFPAGLFDESAEADDFAASWESWRAVDSPIVAKVLEVVDIGGSKALISEVPKGQPLRKLLDDGRVFTAAEVIAVGLELCGGLSALHGRGLAHGDVKPSTIVIVQEDTRLAPMLIDCGVTSGLWAAKHLGEQTALIGTPFYAPIEQFGGTAPDGRSDVYNLATVLFEMATGVLPWKGKSFLEVFQAKLEKVVPFMASRSSDVRVPKALEKVIAVGLATDSRDRFPDAIHFGAALADLAE